MTTQLASDFLGGGGGGIPIDGVLPLNLNQVASDLHAATDGTVWLKTGTVETDTASYPDASANVARVLVDSYSVAEGTMSGFNVWDGTYVWTNNSTDDVFAYDQDGVYQSISYTGLAFTNAYGATWDGTHFWVVEDSAQNALHKFDATWNLVSTNTTSIPNNLRAITWDGTSLWLYVGSSTETVQEWSNVGAGSYTGTTIDLTVDGGGAGGTAQFILWDGANFWMDSDQGVWKYGSNWVWTGEVTSGSMSNSYGAAWDGTHVWTSISNTKYKYFLGDTVGYGDASTDTDTGLPIYVRIA
jgi:hypothetical protein